MSRQPNCLNAETLNLLAKGFDADPAEQRHLESCPLCRRLLEEFVQPTEELAHA